ncbi:MAG TPA: antitoxin Xre/MbcA/ParS toxin-binding domain-containing protein [Solirubrobacteraceae bacterium]|nr:antitoxin Xre/MbcA/ParS toxin-binding domain-containing protein [Solirubrobacteraceae bacterium]
MAHSAARRIRIDELPSGEAVYARIVKDTCKGGLSMADLARVVGVGDRQVRNWSAGASTPRGHSRDRLLELHYVTRQLREVYSREGAEIWLHGRKKSLGGRRPIDLLAAGEFDEVLDAIERMNAGAM